VVLPWQCAAASAFSNAFLLDSAYRSNLMRAVGALAERSDTLRHAAGNFSGRSGAGSTSPRRQHSTQIRRMV